MLGWRRDRVSSSGYVGPRSEFAVSEAAPAVTAAARGLRRLLRSAPGALLPGKLLGPARAVRGRAVGRATAGRAVGRRHRCSPERPASLVGAVERMPELTAYEEPQCDTPRKATPWASWPPWRQHAREPLKLPRATTMITYWDIRAALPGRPRWQLVGFAASCAERLAPMAAYLGGRVMAEAAEAGGNLAWAAAGQLAAKAEVEQMTTELIRMLDATPRDPLGLDTYTVEALHITVLALKTASTSAPTHEAQGANLVAIDLLGQVDFLLAHSPLDEELLIQRDEDPELPPGPLESGEIEAQWESIALLDKKDRPDARVIEAVRRLSRTRAAELTKTMPEFARRWTEEQARAESSRRSRSRRQRISRPRRHHHGDRPMKPLPLSVRRRGQPGRSCGVLLQGLVARIRCGYGR